MAALWLALGWVNNKAFSWLESWETMLLCWILYIPTGSWINQLSMCGINCARYTHIYMDTSFTQEIGRPKILSAVHVQSPLAGIIVQSGSEGAKSLRSRWFQIRKIFQTPENYLVWDTGVCIIPWTHCRGRTILPGCQNPLASCQNFAITFYSHVLSL